MSKLSTVSTLLSRVFFGLTLIAPIAIGLMGWLSFTAIHVDPPQGSLFASEMDIVFGLIPLLITALCFWILSQLFNRYAKGEYFTLSNIRDYRKLGFLLVIQVFFELLSTLYTDVFLTTSDQVIVNISDIHFDRLLIGAIVLCISWVFEQARKIEEENKMTI